MTKRVGRTPANKTPAPELKRVAPASRKGKRKSKAPPNSLIGTTAVSTAPPGVPQPTITMREFLTSPKYLGPQFGGPSWRPHRVLLQGSVGEHLTDEERSIFKKFTKRDYVEGVRCSVLAIIGGRRMGKSRCAAACVAYFSTAFDLTDRLAPNENAVLGVMSATKQQSGKVFSYVVGIFNSVEILKPYIKSITREVITLTNQIEIRISAADHKTIRSGTAWLYIFDEYGFFPTDEFGVTSDKLIMDAALPALSSLNGMCIIISTPLAKKGELWNIFKQEFHEGGDPEILVAHGSTTILSSI